MGGSQLRGSCELAGWEGRESQGGVLGSVGPGLVAWLERALRLRGVQDIIEVSSGVKTGLSIRSEQPRQVGSDRVACAVAARAKGKLPCVVACLGTATTFTVLDAQGALVGSAITAGVRRGGGGPRAAAAPPRPVGLERQGGGGRLYTRDGPQQLPRVEVAWRVRGYI